MVGEGDGWRQTAIASRDVVPAPVAAAIAEVGEANACLTLIENDGSDVPGFALGRIVLAVRPFAGGARGAAAP